MTGGFVELTAAEEGVDSASAATWSGECRVLGPSWVRMPILTVGFFGISILWSVEMTYASPYLLSLGISKSHMSLVFLAGPLSGLLVQPLVGALADSSKSRFGRRRPYMALGCLITTFAMLLLGFTRDIASFFTVRNSFANDTLTKWLAVLSIYSMDFAINAVMAVDRALIVDTLPTSQQAEGNAWAARMTGFGGLVGFFVGNVDLLHWFPWLGQSQLAILSVIASLLIIGSHLVTITGVKEKVLISTSSPREGLAQALKTLFQSVKILPMIVQQIFKIQFFGSLAWFPMMFFLSTYISELYEHANPEAPEGEGTRLASRMQFYTSILSLTSTFVLPLFTFTEESCMKADIPSNTPETKTVKFTDGFFKIHLANLWAIGHAIFAFCLLSTWFIHDVDITVYVFVATGFSGAVGAWAPFALMGEALHPNSSKSLSDGGYIPLVAPQGPDVDGRGPHFGNEDNEVDNTLDQVQDKIDAASDIRGKAGAILGIHNVFIVIPQFLVTGLSSIIFFLFDQNKKITQNHQASEASQIASNGTLSLRISESMAGFIRDEKNTDANASVNSLSVIFCFGGFAALVASALTYRLARKLQKVC